MTAEQFWLDDSRYKGKAYADLDGAEEWLEFAEAYAMHVREAAQGEIEWFRQRDAESFEEMRKAQYNLETVKRKLAELKASLVKVDKPKSYEERMNKFCRCVVPNESNVCANCHRPIYDERGN